MWVPNMNCLKLLLHAVESAAAFARLSAGNSIAARIAMMAITTRSSINVKAPVDSRFCQRAFARLPASFLFMAVGYSNPVAAICL